MHDEENLRYERLVKDILFFGEEIPIGMFPDLDIENIADNVNNNATVIAFWMTLETISLRFGMRTGAGYSLTLDRAEGLCLPLPW